MSEPASQAVFLSYASQDAEAAKRICEALRAAGVEVWFDQNELVGGDAWDQKIRGQIKACALFVPVISAATQARREGYFRLEWKLAAQRTHMISERQAFLLPVVIDATSDAAADVPEEFRAVQWTRLPGADATVLEKFCARVGKLLRREGAVAGSDVGARLDRAHDGGRGRATSLHKPARLWWVMAVAGVFVAGMIAVWRPWHSAPMAPLAAGSEARQLAGRVRDMVWNANLLRAELDAADLLCKRAVGLDPADAEVWAAWSQVNARYVFLRLDISVNRRAAVGDCATRAMALDPKSFEVRLAQADCWLRGAPAMESLPNKAAARKLLEELSQERPADSRVLILMAFASPLAEAIPLYERVAQNRAYAVNALTDLAWAHYHAKDFSAAERVVERAIAVQPVWGNLGLKVYLALFWRGDPELARATLSLFPPGALPEDWSIVLGLWTAERQGDGPAIVEILKRWPREWLNSLQIDAPTAFILGGARRISGQTEAGRRDYRRAVELLDARLTTSPNDSGLLEMKAEALWWSGEREEARRVYRLLVEMKAKIRARVRVLFESTDEFLNWVEQEFQTNEGWTEAELRLNPAFNDLRQQPRFVALLARAKADPRRTRSPAPQPKTLAIDEKSVAVLAFANVGGDKDNEIFSDGISEELINVLGRVPGLTVKGRASSFFFKGSTATAQEKGQRLGATYLVDGSVRRQGNSVRITAQVSRAATDEVVWSSEPVVRELKDMWAVQEEIAGLIAKALSLKLGVASAAAKSEVNPEVYRLYLEGRAAWRQRTAAGSVKAEQLFRQVLALDPNFARGHAGLADVWVVRAQSENSAGQLRNRNDALMDQAMAGARQALQLDPNLAEAHSALGSLLWMDWKLDEAIREHRAAVALNPSDASAHQRLGRALLTDGRVDEAVDALRRAHELDPLFARIADNYSVALIAARRLEEAVAVADRALALQPELRQALGFKAVALADLGRKEEVLAAARRYTDGAGALEQDMTPSMIAYALARVKAAGEAGLLLARVPEEKRQTATAAALLELGKREEAFALLRAGNSNVTAAEVVLWWPVFDAVREEPEFKATIAAMGLNEAHARARAWRAAQMKAR